MSSMASQIPSLTIIYSTIYSGADKENTSKLRWDCAFDKISVAWNEGKSICPFVGYMRFPVSEHQTWTNSIRLFHRQMFAIRSNTDLEKVFFESNYTHWNCNMRSKWKYICLKWLSNIKLNIGYAFICFWLSHFMSIHWYGFNPHPPSPNPPPPPTHPRSWRLVHVFANLF